ncbi:uncharacterized protein [Cicer arietinum]|uniref:Probable serine incorporator n=1 Tax=Cicer arietinum TaxID=3827 RepID=A0A1S2Z0R5_CICAR|nr:probable serine incorporator [Cicer arietinum]
METRERNNSTNQQENALKDSSWYDHFKNVSNPLMARYVYALIFLVSNVLAWATRDELTRINSWTKFFKGLRECNIGITCLGPDGVLKVSMGCFLFFMVMFCSTTFTSKLNGVRDKWHSGWWSIKIVLWILLTIIPFLLPSKLIDLYGKAAHFGSGVFLIIQLISIVSFIIWINDCCIPKKNSNKCQFHVLLLSIGSYVICLAGIVFMYISYAPKPSCLLNIFFITWTLVLLQLMISVSLHSKINGGILSPALMGLYVVYLCWGAIRSEPEEACFRKPNTKSKTQWHTIISFVIGLLAIVYATFSTGIDSQCFQKSDKQEEEDDDVPYGYGFFHFVFATGAMYFAMLLNGWNSNHSMRKWTIDVGWTSTWVKVANEWLTVFVYLWMLIAPVINKRDTEST